MNYTHGRYDMPRTIPTGEQSFVTLRRNDLFYIDKTKFIKDWWNSRDHVTLITRPRRFGKTLMLDTVKTFFSPEFKNETNLFEGLNIWNDRELRTRHGRIPVIFLSFADIKGIEYSKIIKLINSRLVRLYNDFRPLIDIKSFSDTEKEQFTSVCQSMDETTAQDALIDLCKYLTRQSKCKPIILLDEYDTPLQEAWINGYWDAIIDFMRGLFNSTFKTNPWLERGLMTGITRISKESIFSDLNNIEVVGTTSELYSDCFGFTEQEVFSAMDEYNLTDKDEVKQWYNGFIFGSNREIYNPWSIINYLKKKRFAPYWALTSSNALVGTLLAQATPAVKEETNTLLQGKSIITTLDEQIVYSQLHNKHGAIWSFLMAAGYVKPLSFDYVTKKYEITLTNREVRLIMEELVSEWFNNDHVDGYLFRQALLTDNLVFMNKFLTEIAEKTFSFFDTAEKNSERFYHAFILGLIVDLKGRYKIRSNRESGFGRYDIIMFPKKKEDHGIIIEFKTMQKNCEKNLNETCINALRQIKEKKYSTELLAQNIDNSNIYIYGFAFKGKTLLVLGGAEQKLPIHIS